MPVTYKIVTPDLFQKAYGLYKEYYLPYDPVLKAVGCTEVCNNDTKMVFGFLEQGLSWCAVDEDTGKMIGIHINHCISMAELPDLQPTVQDYVTRGWSKQWALVWHLFGCAFDIKQILAKYKADKIMEFFALCVHSDYKRRGIATEVVKRSLHHASQCGHTLFAVLCTSAYTQQLYEKQGFDKFNEVQYSMYVDSETQTPLGKDVEEPHKAIISYVKQL